MKLNVEDGQSFIAAVVINSGGKWGLNKILNEYFSYACIAFSPSFLNLEGKKW